MRADSIRSTFLTPMHPTHVLRVHRPIPPSHLTGPTPQTHTAATAGIAGNATARRPFPHKTPVATHLAAATTARPPATPRGAPEAALPAACARRGPPPPRLAADAGPYPSCMAAVRPRPAWPWRYPCSSAPEPTQAPGAPQPRSVQAQPRRRQCRISPAPVPGGAAAGPQHPHDQQTPQSQTAPWPPQPRRAPGGTLECLQPLRRAARHRSSSPWTSAKTPTCPGMHACHVCAAVRPPTTAQGALHPEGAAA